MAGQVVLTPWRCAALALAATCALVSAQAHAQSDEPDAILRRPERLTVAVADEFLGQLAPDAQTLYFVSNRNTTSQIFAQGMTDGRVRLLFDDDADATWPRVSPDGNHVLYVSFRQRVLGQLCVRDLPGGGGRRCLADRSAALQAEWIDRSRIVLVSRPSMNGDLRVSEVDAGATLTEHPLLDRNLTGPAVSPDGQWLAYVPVERQAPSVGPAFAARAADRLEVLRLGSPAAAPTAFRVDLPGLTAQPAFALDGRSIYFVQFVSDSNHDGVVDANDDGVLFRVPFLVNGGTPVAGTPEQLTESSYDCEYPTPAADRLVATCSQGRGLEVYVLPLDGEVPDDWTPDRLADEMDNADARSARQLLAARRLAGETTVTARRLSLLNLILLHLDLGEYEPAAFYARRVADTRDHATAGLTRVVLALVDQRRAARELERGVDVGKFDDLARRRLEGLRLPDASPLATTLAHVVKSEIADSLGDKALARAELEAVTPDATLPGPIAVAYYERAEALYRELDDREALVGVGVRLSECDGLTPDERLHYARAAVRAMVRGLSPDAAATRLASVRSGVPADSELAFALDLGGALLSLRDRRPPPDAVGGLLALYSRQGRPGRRRALIDDASRRAREVGADAVIEALARRYVEDARPGTRDRRAAERLYRGALTRRALRSAVDGNLDDARADFDAISEQTGSYEAVVGSIDVRLKGGEAPERIEATYTRQGVAPALSNFARAYLLARRVHELDGGAGGSVAAQAHALLRASWGELRSKRIAQALDGALLHEQYLGSGDPAFAERANAHYTIALELTGAGTRLRAMILGQLGVLHAQVGNFRIALGYLQERDRLPYEDGPEGLGVRLALARALLHVDREGDAATAADEAVAMVDRTPSLEPYRALALDRDAVCNLAAGRFARALALYDAQMPGLDAATGPIATRNRFVARVARAAAAVGARQPVAALGDLAEVERGLDDPAQVELLRWGHGSVDHVVRTYKLIAAGLRAKAYRELLRLDDEARSIAARRAILQQRFIATRRTEYERAAMLAEVQLALSASDRGDAVGAGNWLREAVVHADDLRARAHGEFDAGQLDVLWLAARLSAGNAAPVLRDLAQRLQAASDAVGARRDPRLRGYQRWFEAYLPLVATQRWSSRRSD